MMTYNLIRKVNPQLALDVRNIANGDVFDCKEKGADGEESEGEGSKNNPNADYFVVTLDSFKVRAVVEALVKASNSQDMGAAIMTKALVEDWLALARKMVADMPEQDRPSF